MDSKSDPVISLATRDPAGVATFWRPATRATPRPCQPWTPTWPGSPKITVTQLILVGHLVDTMRTRPHDLERSEAQQPAAQHGMDIEAQATSPQQEMGGRRPRRRATRRTQPTSAHCRSPSLAGVCQHTPAGHYDWHHKRPLLCGAAHVG